MNLENFRSFADPETHFTLVREERPIGDGGLVQEVPAGRVKCDCCEAVAENIEEIPHDQDCPQRGVHSRWYAAAFFVGDDG